jgi:hypothetical protein
MNRGTLNNSTNDHDDSTNKDTHATPVAVTNKTDEWSRNNASKREDSRHNAKKGTTRLSKI